MPQTEGNLKVHEHISKHDLFRKSSFFECLPSTKVIFKNILLAPNSEVFFDFLIYDRIPTPLWNQVCTIFRA